MMSSRELVRRAVHFQRPERLPVFFESLGVDDGVYVSWNQLGTGDHARRETIDEWGCTWARSEVKNMGQVKGHPLAEDAAWPTYRWPDGDAAHFYTGVEERFPKEHDQYCSTGIFMLLFERMHALCGFEKVLTDLCLDRPRLEELADRIVEFDLKVIRQMVGRAQPEPLPLTRPTFAKRQATVGRPLPPGERRDEPKGEPPLPSGGEAGPEQAERVEGPGEGESATSNCIVPAQGRLDGFNFTDDWGTELALFISPALWRDFFQPRYKRIFDACHAAGWDVWMHSCGKVNAIIGDLIDIGLDVINLQQPRALGIEEIGRQFAGKICFQSLCDIQHTLPFKSAAEIRAEARLLLECWGTDDGGFVLGDYGDGAAIGVPDTTKRIMFDAFLEFDRWRNP